MFKLSSVLCLALMAGWGQTAPPVSFEVASVKPAVPGPWRESKAGVDRVDFASVTLRYCIAFAYRVKEYQVSGPAWLGTLRFDILAKGPDGTRHEQLADMMQVLLAERFKLQVHRETKEYNVYALSVGKGGPKLKESASEAGSGASFGMSSTAAGVGRLEGKGATMASLANTISRIVGSPVVDSTALSGRYDLELEFSTEESKGMRMAVTPGASPAPAADAGVSIFSSLQLLGLKLDAQKIPQDSIVVDHAEKTATEN